MHACMYSCSSLTCIKPNMPAHSKGTQQETKGSRYTIWWTYICIRVLSMQAHIQKQHVAHVFPSLHHTHTHMHIFTHTCSSRFSNEDNRPARSTGITNKKPKGDMRLAVRARCAT